MFQFQKQPSKIVENQTFSGRVLCVSNFTKNKILYIHFLILLPDFQEHLFQKGK